MLEALRWTLIVAGASTLLYGLWLVYSAGPYWGKR